jgi:hypothetical protein
MLYHQHLRHIFHPRPQREQSLARDGHHAVSRFALAAFFLALQCLFSLLPSSAQADDYAWLSRCPGFDSNSCFPFYRISESQVFSQQALFLRYAGPGGASQFELASKSCHTVPIQLEPPNLLNGLVLDFESGAKDSPHVAPAPGTTFKRLRAGIPQLEYLELLRALAACPIATEVLDVRVWKENNHYDGVIVIRNQQFRRLFTARYVSLNNNTQTHSYRDPNWDDPINEQIFPVQQIVDIQTTSFATAASLRNALLPLLQSLPAQTELPVFSLGSRGFTYRKDASFVQVPNPINIAPITFINPQLFETKLQQLGSSPLAFPTEKKLAETSHAEIQSLYDTLITLSAMSTADIQSEMNELGLVQHPTFLLSP